MNSFTGCINALNLVEDEVIALLSLIVEERKKNDEVNKLVTNDLETANLNFIDQLVDRPELNPITATITAAEVRLGRAFLNAMRLKKVGDNLGFWQGMGGQYQDIHVGRLADRGWEGLLSQERMLGDESVKRLLHAVAEPPRPQPNNQDAHAIP
ncbi:hypothetical protein VTK26DRAFT_5189 [Humicola hyalothermophila]